MLGNGHIYSSREGKINFPANSAYNSRSNAAQTYVISRESELGRIIELYQNMDDKLRNRLMGYIYALSEMQQKDIPDTDKK